MQQGYISLVVQFENISAAIISFSVSRFHSLSEIALAMIMPWSVMPHFKFTLGDIPIISQVI